MHFTRSVCAATELSIWLQPKKRVIIYVKRDETIKSAPPTAIYSMSSSTLRFFSFFQIPKILYNFFLSLLLLLLLLPLFDVCFTNFLHTNELFFLFCNTH